MELNLIVAELGTLHLSSPWVQDRSLKVKYVGMICCLNLTDVYLKKFFRMGPGIAEVSNCHNLKCKRVLLIVLFQYVCW